MQKSKFAKYVPTKNNILIIHILSLHILKLKLLVNCVRLVTVNII